MENIEEYRERFARAHKHTYNAWGWAGLIDDLHARAQSRAAKNRLDNIDTKICRKIPWSGPREVLQNFLADEWDNLEERREEIKNLIETCDLFSLSDENGNPLEISERVKMALLTRVFGPVEVHQVSGSKCPAHELPDCNFATSIVKSMGLVEEHRVRPEKIQNHIDLMIHILENGGMDLTPDLSYSCSGVAFVTVCEPKTVVLSEEIVELERKEIWTRGTVEVEKDETVQLPRKTAERLEEEGAAAKFVYRCDSCGNRVGHNEPGHKPSDCPECGSSKIHGVHPETPKEVADVLEKYYHPDTEVETFLEELTVAFEPRPKLTEESYPRIDTKQAGELASKIAPGKERNFLDKAVDRFIWRAGKGKEKSNGIPSRKKSFRHEGDAPIEKVARESE